MASTQPNAKPLELFYSAEAVGVLCGGRSARWAIEKAKAGEFGRVFCDGGGWLIPSSGLHGYLAQHVIDLPQPVAIQFKQ